MILFATLNMLACIAWALAWRWRVKPLWIVAPEQRPERAPGNFKISVIIPARNEGRRLPALLSSLREIGGVAEIIVADDSSSDNTRECADLAARLDPRIRAFSAPAKPDGWVGKPWALHHAARLARGDCLVFMDADVTPGAGVLDIAASIMAGRQLDALSLIPAMRTPSTPAACLLACLASARALFLKPARPGRPGGIAQGAFFAIRRGAYDAVGGHAAVSGRVVEDVALGRLLEEKGFRVLTLAAQDMLQTLAYSTLRETWVEMQKHIYPALGFSARNALLLALGIGFLAIYPPIMLLAALAWSVFHPSPAALAMSGSAVAATLAAYSVLARVIRQEGLPLIAVAAAPLAFLAAAGMLAGSVLAYTRARGRVAWKDRHYPAR